jgi:hypothetical protein
MKRLVRKNPEAEMAQLKAYVTSLVVFVAAAFFVGLVVGANYGSLRTAPAGNSPAAVQPDAGGAPKDIPVEVEEPKQYAPAPDFLLEEPETGKEVKLADFAGSNVLLFVATDT